MKLNEIPVDVLQEDTIYVWDNHRLVQIEYKGRLHYDVQYNITSLVEHEEIIATYGNCPVKLKTEVKEFFEGGE